MPAFALISWPLIAIAMFAALGPARGLIWSVVIGYLFLPALYPLDVPALPSYDKNVAISLGGGLGFLLFAKPDAEVKLGDPLIRKILLPLLGIWLLSPIATWLTNQDFLVNGPAVRPGLSVRDAVSMMVANFISIVPVLLGWRLLQRPEHWRELLNAIVICGLAYSFLVLFERRMSPQLNIWVYNYFPHDWIQHLRGGGYRPLVFLGHGLAVGLFLLTATIAAFSLSREASKRGMTFILVGAWFFLVLSLSRNFGATFLALLLVPLVVSLSARFQVRVAVIISLLFLLYPATKQAYLSPDRYLMSVFEQISPERAASLGVRVDNEQQLLDRALERPVFGWGGWGRTRILNDQGRDISIVDGIWIVIISRLGWVGYLGFFGLLLAPIFCLRRSMRRKEIPLPILGCTIITVGNVIDMVPNSTLSPLGLVIIGAIASYVQNDMVHETAPGEAANAGSPQREVRYSRFRAGDQPVATPQRASTPYRRS